MGFTDSIGGGFKSATSNSVGVVWSGLNLSGNVAVGSISFTLPASAGSGQSYSAAISGLSAELSNVIVPVSIGGASAVLVVTPLSITGPASLPSGTVNLAYTSTTITANGGSSIYTWSATGLPTGLNIGSGTGAITGSPTVSVGSPYSVTVTVTDSLSNTATKTYSLTVNPGVTITGPASLPVGTLSAVYPSTTVGASGGNGVYTWSQTGLPPGLGIGPGTGTISGTPTSNTGSPYSVVVTVTDSSTLTASKNYSVTVNGPLSITGPASIPLGTANSLYSSTTITATGGSGIYTWSATGLPGGMGIGSGSGTISGTPSTNAGSPFSVQVTVTDSNSATASKSYSLTVNQALVITGPPSLPLGILGIAYPNTTATATGGSGSYTWSAPGLPGGLGINPATGVISGTPTTATGSPFNVQVTVTDSNSVVITRAYALTVNGPLSISGPASLPPGTVNTAYQSTTITATGGSGVYTWFATGLPGGMSIGPNSGAITGTPASNTGSPFSVQVTVTDSNFSTANKSYSLTIGALPLSITTQATTLPSGIVNVAYAPITILAQGGIGSYTWSATGLPPGMSISPSDGTISGTPTSNVGNPYSVQVTVTDSTSATASHTLALSISGVLTVGAPASLPAAGLGVAYQGVTFTAGGGVSPYTWTATGLPAGLTLGITSGILGGTPTTSTGSPFTVQVTVTDSTNAKASRSYALTVTAPLSITGPASLPTGTAGVAYASTTITATGGTGVYTWSEIGLPSGMGIAPTTGVISGTPATNTGSPFSVQVKVIDSNGLTASATYSLTINPVATTAPVITGISNAAGAQLILAPNAYASIYGLNFAPAAFTDDWSKSIVNGQLPITLDNVKVSIGGQPAYVSYVSATQINVLLPSVGFGSMAVTVTTSAGTSLPASVTVQQYSPAAFPWPNGQPVATHVDFSLAAKPGTFPTQTTVAAKPGEAIIVWATGYGPTTPAYPGGVQIPASPTFNTTIPVTVTIAGVPSAVYGTALASSFAGLYQLVVTVPATLPNGDYPLIATINGTQAPTVTLTVSN